MSPTGTSVVERSADDITTPVAITASATPAASPTVSPSAIAMSARDRALRRDDRRDDRDLADRQRHIGEHQPEAVAQPRDEEQHEDERGRRTRGAAWRWRAAGRRRVPIAMTQASTTSDPSIRLERDEQRVAADHRTAAARPPRIAVTGRVCRVAGAVVALVAGGGSGRGPVIPSAFAPGAHPVPRARRPSPTHQRSAHLGQDAPHLDGRSHAVGTQASPSGREPPRGPPAAPQRREDIRREGPPAASAPADEGLDANAALLEALSALDRAAKAGAIHPNAAARRKSRLIRKVNAAVGGAHVQVGGRVVKTTGKAAAAKAAKARIAAGKADKAKGAQTAAGKARAALSKTARAEAAAAKEAAALAAAEAATAPAKASATKAPAKAAAKKPAAKATAAPRRRHGQGRDGDRQGRAQGEEGRHQVVGLAEPAHDGAPTDGRGVSIRGAGRPDRARPTVRLRRPASPRRAGGPRPSGRRPRRAPPRRRRPRR